MRQSAIDTTASQTVSVGRAMVILRNHGVETMMNGGVMWARCLVTLKWIRIADNITVAGLYDFLGY